MRRAIRGRLRDQNQQFMNIRDRFAALCSPAPRDKGLAIRLWIIVAALSRSSARTRSRARIAGPHSADHRLPHAARGAQAQTLHRARRTRRALERSRRLPVSVRGKSRVLARDRGRRRHRQARNRQQPRARRRDGLAMRQRHPLERHRRGARRPVHRAGPAAQISFHRFESLRLRASENGDRRARASTSSRAI